MTTNEFKLTGSDVFGRYCRIEMKNFISQDDFFIHKCIRTYMGNRYRDVPLVAAKGEYVHTGGPIDLVSVITCGIDETEVFAVPLESVEFIPNNERTCHNSAPHYLRFLCSECHYVIYHDDVNEMGEPDEDGIKFCPNCGARVVSSDDKEMER